MFRKILSYLTIVVLIFFEVYAGIRLLTISTYSAMIEAAAHINYVKESDIATLQQWRQDPANWTPSSEVD